jgi:poly(A) polymerase
MSEETKAAEPQSPTSEEKPKRPRRRRKPKAEAKPEAKTEVQNEAEIAVKTEAKPAVKREAKPAVKRESKPAVKREPKPAAKREANSESPAATAEPKLESATDSEPKGDEEAGTRRRRGARGGRSNRRGGRGRRAAEELNQEDIEPGEGYDLQVEAWRKHAEQARVPLKIPEALISNDALRIVEKLNELGHLSYVVGGCVRDLALGTEPKDFDVVTTARPQQVRRAFRYARIIGRRFRLVHVHFGRDRMIEVATFRAQVPEVEEGDDLLVRDDNVYGAPEEDAMRRDFTVNGLFYDPISGSVVDYVEGMKDLRNKVIRSIGPADTRIQEDPVRILRALRFSAKLGFALDGEMEQAIRKHGGDILRCSPARLWEELLKILRCGHAAQAFPLAQDLGFLQHLLPEVSEAMRRSPKAHMQLFEALDGLVGETGHAPDDLLLLAVLVLPLLPSESPRQALEQLAGDWNERFRLPRRLRERLEDAVLSLRSMVPEGPWVDQQALARRAFFGDAVELLNLLTRASGQGRSLLKTWRLLHRPEDEGAE